MPELPSELSSATPGSSLQNKLVHSAAPGPPVVKVRVPHCTLEVFLLPSLLLIPSPFSLSLLLLTAVPLVPSTEQVLNKTL